MTRRLAVVFLAIACSCGGRAGVEREASTLTAGLLDAERAFGDLVAQRGKREAMLRFASDEAVIYRPDPVLAREWYSEISEGGGLLRLTPRSVEVSSSGDLGYVIGSWEFREQERGELLSSGYYLTVWEKDQSGRWRLALHVETVHPGPVPPPASVEERLALPRRRTPLDESGLAEERDLLMRIERLFSQESEEKGLVAAYMAFSAEDVRLFRMNEEPSRGKTRVRKALQRVTGTATWEPAFAGVSRAGDLAYTYGVAEVAPQAPAAPVERRSYARIWRMDSDGRWSLAVDVSLPGGMVQPEKAPE